MHVAPRDYIHPEDQAALENLRAIPLFDACVKGFLKLGLERMLHGLNMAQKVRLGPNQLPNIYKHMPPACHILGIEEPEFYLEMNPSPNAYTMGDSRIFITVTSGLVEQLSEEEVQAVVAHECGHIACRHTLYHTMAQMLIKCGSAVLGPLAMLSAPVRVALLYWYRRSELTADRAAAVVVKGPQPVVQTMIRLAGGPKSLTGQINLDLYQEQADAYDRLLESNWDAFLQGLAIPDVDHPFPSVRAREIMRWCDSEHFRRLVEALDGDTGPKCPGCGKPFRPEWKFCRHCGRPVEESGIRNQESGVRNQESASN